MFIWKIKQCLKVIFSVYIDIFFWSWADGFEITCGPSSQVFFTIIFSKSTVNRSFIDQCRTNKQGFFFYSPALHKWLLLYLNHEVSITQVERVDKKFWSLILQDIRLYHSNVHGGSKIFLKEGTVLPPFPWIFFFTKQTQINAHKLFLFIYSLIVFCSIQVIII